MIFLLGLRFSDPPEMEEAEGISATRFLEKSGGCKKEILLEPEVYTNTLYDWALSSYWRTSDCIH